ncbi:MAG: NAD(+)/NADH kinase [Limisphaerales bacterium]
MKRVGLTANPEKIASRQLIRRVARTIEKHGRAVLADSGTARMADLSVSSFPDVTSLAREVDLLLVFGGDGTMLSAARSVAGLPTPMLGVNIGSLGFLTEIPGARVAEELPAIWEGNFTIEERSLLEATGLVADDELFQVVLNDFVISRGATSRLIELEVLVNGEALTNYRADGLIVSSPTGSTAYSLAAGGAIVSPSASVLTLTPICPHTLSNRSVIVSSDSVIEVRVRSQKLEIYLTADGQVQMPLFFGNKILVRKSDKSVRLVRLPNSSFFQTLRQKLNWSGSSV